MPLPTPSKPTPKAAATPAPKSGGGPGKPPPPQGPCLVPCEFGYTHPGGSKPLDANNQDLSEQDKQELGFDYFDSVALVESPVRFRDIRLITHHSIHDRNDRDATVINTNYNSVKNTDDADSENSVQDGGYSSVSDSLKDQMGNLSTVDKILISIEDYVKETDFPDIVHLEA